MVDFPEPDSPTSATISDALYPDGVFVFSILHPCFFDQAPVQDPDTGEWHRHVRGYLEHEQRWITSFGGHTHYHRPLSWYVDRLAAYGLAVTGLHEPATLPAHRRPTTQWSAYERWFATIPTMIAVACRPVFQQTRHQASPDSGDSQHGPWNVHAVPLSVLTTMYRGSRDPRAAGYPSSVSHSPVHFAALNGTDHADRDTRNQMIHDYLARRNQHAEDQQRRQIVQRANVA